MSLLDCYEATLPDETVLVKVEPQMCRGCLSTARRAAPIPHLCSVLAMLTPHLPWDTTLSFCWECIATLRRIERFQIQLRNAHEMLTQMVQTNLSTLTVTTKDFYDQEIHYKKNDNIDLKTSLDIKEESSENKIQMTVEKFEKKNVLENNDTNERTDDIFVKNDTNERTGDIFDKNDTVSNANVDDVDDCPSDYDNKYSKTTTNSIRCNLTKQKIKIQNRNIKKEYKSYARIVVHKWEKPYSQYYTEVELDEEDVEFWFLKSDRKRQGHKMNHKCEECSLIYLRKLDLDRHNNLNHYKAGKPYRCLHCSTTVSSLAGLKSHWRSHSVFYRCTLCARCVFGNSLALHLSRSHVNQYQCTNCTRAYSSLAAFTEHYNKFHRFVCDYCNKRCAMRSALEKHIRGHHERARCAACARWFPSRRARAAHGAAAHRPAPPDLAYCVECDAQFLTRHNYLKHVSAKHCHKPTHTKKSVCPECGKAFNKNYDMQRHYDFAHVKVTDYHCQLCDKYFLKSYGLRIHTESVHLKLPKRKNKICDICGRAFHSTAVLKNHRRTHTGERPFQCQFCSAAFAQKGAMVIHQRKQHGG